MEGLFPCATGVMVMLAKFSGVMRGDCFEKIGVVGAQISAKARKLGFVVKLISNLCCFYRCHESSSSFCIVFG